MESTCRKHRVTAATLAEWRVRFLAGGEAILKSREVDVEDEEKRRLKSAIANISVDNELLRETIARLKTRYEGDKQTSADAPLNGSSKARS